ncbi:expressed protein [Phakopsora pachyrhizi]|uniref:Expressed protein n=1 Tax=Phakopsora pachyrhizi TaxID=170000 RepID=A0AAV0BFF6_PHAPC|nr:expressed protein [Phakopsora pachyrhizi]
MKYLGLFLLFIVALEARELRLNEPILGGTNHRLRRRRPEISGNKAAGPNVSFNPEDKELGKCKDLTIEFGKGFEGKENEVSYEPFDKTHQHGAALNMAIIVTFLCDELVNKCEFKNEDSIFKSCKKYATEMGAVKNNAKKADEWNGMVDYHIIKLALINARI